MRVFSTGSLLTGGVVALSLLGSAPSASACGGFFCSQATPVVQSGERIVFVNRDDGRVTALVQISYSGPAEAFSWVVPVPGVPEVGVSSNTAFQRLSSLTSPQFRLTDKNRCTTPNSGFVDAGAAVDAGAPDGGTGPVVVLDAGSVGPYDYVVLMAPPDDPGSAQATLDWLADNNYDVEGLAAPLFESYLAAGMNLLAFRLQKSAMVGDIRPVSMTYTTDHPMVPIRLTQVAAQDDMDVLVYVLGPARAVPINYPTLELNYRALDWIRGGSNYRQLVTAAANEAGGQGFVTEFAGASSRISALYTNSQMRTWQTILDTNWEGNELGMLFRTISSFGRWDGAQQVLQEYVVLPEGAQLQDVSRCFQCVFGDTSGPLPELNEMAFLGAFEERVMEPMRSTQRLLSEQPYLTRMYTTISASEMTLDPEFKFNRDLPEVSAVHTAERERDCVVEDSSDRPFVVELEDGSFVRGIGFQWPVDIAEAGANRRVVQHGTEGSGTLILDNPPPRSSDTGGFARLPPVDEDLGCGCSSTEGRGLGLSAMFLAMVFVAYRRRR